MRAAPGRFIGKAKDSSGRECRVGVLSTREQHIRKDKATSNICSNQAFIATLVGAALLHRGDEGIGQILLKLRKKLKSAVAQLTRFEGVELAFPNSVSFHEVTFALSKPTKTVTQLENQASSQVSMHLNALRAGVSY